MGSRGRPPSRSHGTPKSATVARSENHDLPGDDYEGSDEGQEEEESSVNEGESQQEEDMELSDVSSGSEEEYCHLTEPSDVEEEEMRGLPHHSARVGPHLTEIVLDIFNTWKKM